MTALGTRLLDRHRPALCVDLPTDLNGHQFLDVTRLIAHQALDRGEVGPRIASELGRGFLLAVIRLVDPRPFRPRVVLGTLGRRLRQDLELRQRTAALAHRRTDTIGAGVAATDHHHIEPLSLDRRALRSLAEQRTGGVCEVIHREVHALQRPALDRKVAWHRRTGAEHDGVEVPTHHLRLVVVADFGVVDKSDAFLFELVDAAHQHLLLVELHVRDAVHQQPARAVSALQHRHRMSGTVELLRSGEPCRTRSHHGDFATRAGLRRLRDDPALLETALDDAVLDVLDRDRRRVDTEHTRPFTGRGTDTPGELGEIVGAMQPLERLAPEPAVDEIVPLGDQVVDRTA